MYRKNSLIQELNYQKSAVFFSANVRRDKQLELSNILGVNNALGDSRYLGLPSLIGRSKKSVFKFVKDRVWNKVQGWGNKLLSKAGKLVLLKNVAQAVPSYCMSCFLLPKTMCSEIERIMNGYWWQSNNRSTKGLRWIAWDKMCTSKDRGGLGFRSLHGFNLALLGKHVWGFIQRPNSLVARVYKARYFQDCNILPSSIGRDASYVWRGIWEAKEQICKGYRWVLGDGQDINAFSDPWLRANEGFCVEDHHLNGFRDTKVSAYFHPNTKMWDEQKVKHDFQQGDAELVLNTRIPQNQVRDRLVWSFSNSGIYTAKSGYHFWYSRNSVLLDTADSEGWKRLWRVKLPHKVKVFLWRFCNNTIPD